MKAVVLVGGLGTRLRPLTETIKKELLPLVDRAILHHTLDRLSRHGVRDVVMSSPYLEDSFAPFIEERAGDPAIRWITEREALDTGGAIVNSLDQLDDEPFFALNGDILTDLDMTAMAGFHEERGAVATIALHRVEDARAFGLVESSPDGRITEFREKPAEIVPGDINAGTYILEPAALRGWAADRPTSIEREIFPRVIGDGSPVFGFSTDAYWLDLGTPDSYLRANFDLLDGRLSTNTYVSPWIHGDADVDPTARLGRHVVVGPGSRIGPDAGVDASVLHDASVVGAGARISGSIVGPRALIGSGASVTDSILGEASSVGDGASIQAARVDPFTQAPG